MPTRRESPKTGLALLDSVLGDAARARRAALLMLAASVAVAIVLGVVLVVVGFLGPTGATVVGGLGTVLAGIAARRRHKAGKPTASE